MPAPTAHSVMASDSRLRKATEDRSLARAARNYAARYRAATAREYIMARRARASSARLDKLKLIPQNRRPFGCGVSFNLPAGRQPGRGLRATKDDEAQPAMFFNRAVRPEEGTLCIERF
jgi:hypothetical protein